MRKKLLATIGLCVCTAFSFCACGLLGKEPEPTTAPSVNNGLSAGVKVGNKTYFSVDGRGFVSRLCSVQSAEGTVHMFFSAMSMGE